MIIGKEELPNIVRLVAIQGFRSSLIIKNNYNNKENIGSRMKEPIFKGYQHRVRLMKDVFGTQTSKRISNDPNNIILTLINGFTVQEQSN